MRGVLVGVGQGELTEEPYAAAGLRAGHVAGPDGLLPAQIEPRHILDSCRARARGGGAPRLQPASDGSRARQVRCQLPVELPFGDQEPVTAVVEERGRSSGSRGRPRPSGRGIEGGVGSVVPAEVPGDVVVQPQAGLQRRGFRRIGREVQVQRRGIVHQVVLERPRGIDAREGVVGVDLSEADRAGVVEERLLVVELGDRGEVRLVGVDEVAVGPHPGAGGIEGSLLGEATVVPVEVFQVDEERAAVVSKQLLGVGGQGEAHRAASEEARVEATREVLHQQRCVPGLEVEAVLLQIGAESVPVAGQRHGFQRPLVVLALGDRGHPRGAVHRVRCGHGGLGCGIGTGRSGVRRGGEQQQQAGEFEHVS